MLTPTPPGRKELLTQIGLESEIGPSWMEEKTREKKPSTVVMELSRQKAEDIVSGCLVSTMVIGANTVVSVGNGILGKPGTPMRAYEILEEIRDRTYQIYTGITVLLCQGKDRCRGTTFMECTDVHVYPMTCREMKEYVRCDEPLDKAGAYGIQGRFAAYMKRVGGGYANVVELPVGRLYQRIKRLLEDRKDG